jgi:PAS domain S-box-containing protein
VLVTVLSATVTWYLNVSLNIFDCVALASSLVSEIEENFQSNELYRAKFGSKEEDSVVGGDRNPYIYLPLVLQKFNADVNSIEITGRLLWHNTGAKENVEAAYRLYRSAERAYPDLAYVKFLRANCLTYLSPDPTAFIDQIEGVKKLEPGLLTEFLVYKRDMETKYRGSMTKNEGNDASDMVTYVEFQKYYSDAQKYNKLAITAIRNFWELFLQPSIAFSTFNKMARMIELHTQKALSTYKTLIVRYPKHIYIISSYAYFLDLVIHNAEEAERYHRRADQLRARENDETGLSEGGADSQAVISISEDGVIEQVNNATTKLFGWSRIELLTRNIKLIVPSPYKEKHDQFLDRYKATGNAKVIGLPPRKLFGQHRDGYSFSINLQVAERRKENGDRAYVGTLIQTDIDSDEGIIIINEEGVIILINKRVTQMFGYSAVELLRNNITMCMIDAYAANHETYLRRYKETGEAKVIGTAGRNVPARRKDATVFPASLVVEEEYIGGEKFFLAHVLDTTHVTAIIYIDGMGTVQNCDQGISVLLGYRKEDLVGQNICGVMPPPYNQYHDMYLERYRRTKVSNILRSTEGRLLPALHADGSVVKIRAIIQRSDNGDGSDNLLFKGMIRRVDTDLANSAEGRIGFDDKNVIEMKKDGTIISVGKSVLNTLSYSSDKDPKEYVGQPIEVLIPPVENRPQQERSFWMSQALADQELNFYILLLNKNYTLFPFTYNLSMKSPDVILMRLRDVLATDALLTIDEIGTILSVNEDAFLLLGHDPDEITGRNISYIQADEVASQHDGYLLRYKETKVARVVGIARQLTTIHRDKSVIPIEIQITDIKTADGVNFVGRLRHVAIEERVPHEFVQSFYKAVIEENNEVLNVAEEIVSSKVDLIDPFEVEVQEKTGSQALSEQDGDTDSESSSSSLSDEEDVENAALTSEVEGKLSKLKAIDKETSSTLRLGYVLYSTFALLIGALLAGLIAANVNPSPEKLFIFLDELSEQSTIINQAIFALRLGIYEEESVEIKNAILSTPGSEGFWECSLGEEYRALGKLVEPCPFIHKFHIKEELEEMVKDLVLSQNWFTTNYPDIRVEGDELDTIFTASLPYKSYEDGMAGAPTSRHFASWTDFIGSGFFDALSKLAEHPIFDGSHIASRLDYQFIQGNRDAFLMRISEIQEGVFQKIEGLLAKEALIHLGILLVIIVIVAVSFFVFMIPTIRSIMVDRLLILKLLLLVPKHLVWDFVFTIYRDDSEDEDGEGEFGIEQAEKAKEDAKAKAMKLRSEEVVDIVNDNVYKLYVFYGLGLASVILPAMIHVIWRYSFNNGYIEEIGSYHDASFLFTTTNSLLWRATGMLAPCSFRRPSDQSFCSNMKAASKDLYDNVVQANKYLKSLQDKYAFNDEMNQLFYSPEVLKEVYKGCSEESSIKIKVDRHHFSHYEYPKKSGNIDYKDGETYTVPEKNYRCDDLYHADEHGPYELRLPEDYATHFTRGIANTLRVLFQYSYGMSQTPGYNVTTPPTGPISEFFMFNIFEASEREATEGIKVLKEMLQKDLLIKYSSSRSAFNATYIVSLIYVLVLFAWVFESARRDLAREIKHNRGILFMIPVPTVAKSKPMVEYVERTLQELMK